MRFGCREYGRCFGSVTRFGNLVKMEGVAVGGDKVAFVYQFSELVSVGGVGHSNSLTHCFRRECKVVSVRIGGKVNVKQERNVSKITGRVLPARVVYSEVWFCRRTSVYFYCPLIRISSGHFNASFYF